MSFTVTKEEALRVLWNAGVSLHGRERCWYGCLYDVGRDLHDALRDKGPQACIREARAYRRACGPFGRQLCIMAIRLSTALNRAVPA